jgi:hypothetical protein
MDQESDMDRRTTQRIGLGALVVLGALGCSKVPKDTSKVLANLVGEKITENQFKETVKLVVNDEKKAQDLLTNDTLKEQRNQFLESLAMQKAMTKLAKAEGVDKDTKVKLQVDQMTARIYFQALTERRATKAEPTEAQLKALYEELVAQRKAMGQDKGLPTFEQIKPQMPAIWKQKQDANLSENLFKELKQKYPVTYADGYTPTPMPMQ